MMTQPADRRLVTEAAGNATYVPQSTLPTLATKAELASRSGGTPATPGFESLGAKIAFGGLGNHTVAVASDSTANDGNDWVRLWFRKYIEWLPESTRCVYHNWRTATSDWSNVIDREGEWTEATDGLTFRDTFEGREGDISGTSPEVGDNWTTGDGWVIENGYLHHPTGSGAIGSSMGAGQGTLKVRMALDLRSISGGSTQQLRIHRNTSSPGTVNAMWVGASANTSGGASFHLYAHSTEIATVDSVGLFPINGGWTDVDIDLTVEIQNVTLTITNPATEESSTTTGVLTENQANVYGSQDGFALLGNVTGDPRWRVYSIEFQGDPTQARGDLFEVWNGAIAGAGTHTFTEAKRAEMWDGKHADILVLGFGHNNGAQTGQAFADQTEAWVDEWLVDHPETKHVIVTSQNPQFAPAANPVAHAERQYAARLLARRKGWDYVPAFESFTALPDGGQSAVGPDGIHPVTPPSGAIEGDSGAVLWADTALRCVTDRR